MTKKKKEKKEEEVPLVSSWKLGNKATT